MSPLKGKQPVKSMINKSPMADARGPFLFVKFIYRDFLHISHGNGSRTNFAKKQIFLKKIKRANSPSA